MKINQKHKIQLQADVSASRMVASAVGVSGGGLAGMMHGYFILRQGNIAPEGIVINAIGPAERA